MKKNIVFINNQESSFESQYSIKSWKFWCELNNCELFILEDKLYEDLSFNKFSVFDLLENNNIEYNQILIPNTNTIINPSSPNIFNITDDKLCGVFYNSSYNWLLRSIENYSKYIFDGFTFPYWEYLDTGIIIVNQNHKSFFKNILDFYLNNQENITQMFQTFSVGTDQPIFNFLMHIHKVNFKILPYEWNMQDMARKEVINPELIFTKIGWIYQFNFLPNKNYWMETTYKKLYK